MKTKQKSNGNAYLWALLVVLVICGLLYFFFPQPYSSEKDRSTLDVSTIHTQ